jgi:hypothetical protein
MQVPPWLKPASWGAVVGAAGFAIVGFAQFGWVLGSTAEQMARQRADAAVVNGLVPICIDMFQHQPDAAARLVQLRQASSWDRRQFVERGGWATMPGSASPNSPLASACADRLIAL